MVLLAVLTSWHGIAGGFFSPSLPPSAPAPGSMVASEQPASASQLTLPTNTFVATEGHFAPSTLAGRTVTPQKCCQAVADPLVSLEADVDTWPLRGWHCHSTLRVSVACFNIGEVLRDILHHLTEISSTILQ